MKILVDTNILVSTIEDSAESEVSAELLNLDEHELGVTQLTLFELRTVLTKKKQEPQQNVERIINWLWQHLDFVIDSAPQFSSVETLQKRTLLYPMDCMILQTALEIGAVATTLEKELREHYAVHPELIVRSSME